MPTMTFFFKPRTLPGLKSPLGPEDKSELLGSEEKPVLQAHPLGYVQDGGVTALQFPWLASRFSGLTP